LEHRLSDRLYLEIPVTLYGLGRKPVAGTTRNIGERGIFVEAEDPSVFDRPLLHLELAVGGPGTFLKCYLAHRSRSGAGLMLVDAELDPNRMAREVLAPFYAVDADLSVPRADPTPRPKQDPAPWPPVRERPDPPFRILRTVGLRFASPLPERLRRAPWAEVGARSRTQD
jgi:hypothetical protein